MVNTLAGKYLLRLTMALSLGVGGMSSVTLAPATQAHARANYQAPRSITIPGGGTATLTVRGFCLNFGLPFPTSDTAPRSLAPDNVRSALNYSVQRGYTDGNPQQVQLAIWYLRDNTWRSEQRATAEEIVREATPANLPTATGEGMSLVDAVAQNRVSVTARFVPQTADAFYGDGTATIRNLGTADVRVYMPIGVTFAATAGGNVQDLVVYELGIQQATTTPGATGTATATRQATAPATLTAITTPQATGTVTTTVTATAGTVTATVEGTATSTVTGTVVQATEEATATPEATDTPTVVATVETPTETPTEFPTDTPVPFDTPTPEGAILPETGVGDGNTFPYLLALIGLSMIIVALGGALRRQRSLS